MLIGFSISGHDNDSYYFDSNDTLLPVCKKCGFVTDYNYISPSMNLKIKKYDFSCTYDNRVIVSYHFKCFCEKNRYAGLDFIELPNDNKFYYFFVKNLVYEDISKKIFRKEKFCSLCNSFESIVPAFPIYLRDVSLPLIDGFYISDIYTGNGNGKVRTIIIGIDTYKKLKSEKLKGIVYKKIEY